MVRRWQTAFWVLVAVAAACATQIRHLIALLGDGRLPGSDDYYRLAQVRDWMAGAGWFNMEQTRLGVDGLFMHWSRLVDLPVAALIWLGGERFAAIVWPLLLFAAVFWIVVTISWRLSPQTPLPLLVMIAAMSSAASQFEPGRFDHHNVQILLMTLTVLGGVDPLLRRGGMIAGLACAASLTVGAEGLAFIAVAGGLFASRWVCGDDPDGVRFGGFGLSFAAGTAFGFFATIAPSRYLVPVCDALSPGYGLPVVLCGLGAWVAVRITAKLPSALTRLSACMVLASAGLAALALIAPECLGGPLAGISADAKSRWLLNVNEARGLLFSLRETPSGYGTFLIQPLFAIAAGLLMIITVPASRRWDWAMLLVPVAAMFALSFFQVRQSQYIAILAIPMIAAALLRLRDELSALSVLRNGNVQRGFAVALVLLTAIGGAVVLRGGKDAKPVRATPALAAASRIQPGDCQSSEIYRRIAALPQGTVLNTHALSGRLIVDTPHRVLVGSYHRSEDVVLDGMALRDRDAADVRRIATARGADYIALCPLDERGLPGSFVETLIAEGPPDWLEPLFSESGVSVFRVKG